VKKTWNIYKKNWIKIQLKLKIKENKEKEVIFFKVFENFQIQATSVLG